MRLRAGVVRGVARGSARPGRRDDAEEAYRVHHGQRAPRVQRRQDAARENELQTKTGVRPHLRGPIDPPPYLRRDQHTLRRSSQVALE